MNELTRTVSVTQSFPSAFTTSNIFVESSLCVGVGGWTVLVLRVGLITKTILHGKRPQTLDILTDSELSSIIDLHASV